MNNICPFLWSWLLLMYITISAYFPTITCDTLASAPFCSQHYANIQLRSAIHLQLSRLHQVFEERRKFNSLGNCKLDLPLLIDGVWNVCHLLRSALHNWWFEWYWNDWNEQGMTEWQWNDGRVNAVTGDFRIKGFAFVQKSPFIWPHPVIPTSFLNDKTDWNEVEMTRMTVEWYLPIVILILRHSKMI